MLELIWARYFLKSEENINLLIAMPKEPEVHIMYVCMYQPVQYFPPYFPPEAAKQVSM